MLWDILSLDCIFANIHMCVHVCVCVHTCLSFPVVLLPLPFPLPSDNWPMCGYVCVFPFLQTAMSHTLPIILLGFLT